MKFYIFSWSEKYYKFVTAIITIAVTIGCFVYYNNLVNKSDTFVMATTYAAFLFIVGLYVSYKTNNISNKLYERKNEYITLKRLDEIFNTSSMTSLTSYEDIINAIITFQVFSGRNGIKVSNDKKKTAITKMVPLDFLIEPKPKVENIAIQQKKHYINQIGFKFMTKLQKREDDYINCYDNLKLNFHSSVNKYISDNGIVLTILGRFSELYFMGVDCENWCNQYVAEESKDKKEELIQFIYQTIKNNQVEFNSLEKKKKKISQYYKKCNKQIQDNLTRMNSIYGNRMEFIINTKEDLMIEIENVLDEIERIKQLIESKNSDMIDKLNECNDNISGLYIELQEEKFTSEIEFH